MRKIIIFAVTAVAVTSILGGCAKNSTAKNLESEKSLETQAEKETQVEKKTQVEKETQIQKEIQIDFGHDYTDDVKSDVNKNSESGLTLQEELENVNKITDKYTPLAEAAQTQMEMDRSAGWLYSIWNTELDILKNRVDDVTDAQVKEKILAEQENWENMKEEMTLINLGAREEGGSIYPQLEASFLEQICKDRAYVLAAELAGINDEAFNMPEASLKYGFFVDNEGTDSVCSSLLIRKGYDNDEAVVSVYRKGQIEGTFTDNGNGELEFTSSDGNIKGVIRNNGWNGAEFEITDSADESVFCAGEKVEFPLAISVTEES